MTIAKPPARHGGYVLTIALHVALLLVVLGEVVYLATNYRQRFDLTEDGLYTLTDSTRQVLGRLEDRLLIECWFSPDRRLSQALRDHRAVLRSVLDEYVQLAGGKIAVQYLDPQSDADLEAKARRLGIKPEVISGGERSLEIKELWQGLHFRYGGSRKHVEPLLKFQLRPSDYELYFTRTIKTLTVDEKPRIGVLEYPTPPTETDPLGRPQGQPVGFRHITRGSWTTDRYEVVTLELGDGQLVPGPDAPAGYRIVVVLRPRALTDRQKYALDQYLMNGGTLVVFADAGDYTLGPRRDMVFRGVSYDDADSKLRFKDQLATYGVRLGETVLLDVHESARVPIGVRVGDQLAPLRAYPYWFRPADRNWADEADALATNDRGERDPQLAAKYAEVFLPGIAEPARILGAPPLYWPCPVDLARDLPEGVRGEVLMRTSPRSLAEEPPHRLQPVGSDDYDYPRKNAEYERFTETLRSKLAAEPLRQYGVMVRVRGTLSSAFDGRPIPPRTTRGDAPTEEPPEADPLADPVGDPLAGGEAEVAGPELPAGREPAPAAADEEPPALSRAADSAQLVVIGDSDFVRDDLVDNRYGQLGGPVSGVAGVEFFLALLDWLQEDRDLLELRERRVADRALRFLDEATLSALSPQRRGERLQARATIVKAMAIGLPVTILLSFGLVVLLRRRVAKRAFLSEVQAR